MPLSTIFQVNRGGVLLVEKLTDLQHVTDKTLSHNVVSSTPRHKQGSNSQL